MTKAEILAEITSNSTRVLTDLQSLTPAIDEPNLNLKTYEVAILKAEPNGNGQVKATIAFYVYDEGGSNEEAYYLGNARAQIIQSTRFADEVKARADQAIASVPALKAVSNINADEKNRSATLTAYFDDNASGAVAKTYLVYGPEGNLTIEEVTG